MGWHERPIFDLILSFLIYFFKLSRLLSILYAQHSIQCFCMSYLSVWILFRLVYFLKSSSHVELRRHVPQEAFLTFTFSLSCIPFLDFHRPSYVFAWSKLYIYLSTLNYKICILKYKLSILQTLYIKLYLYIDVYTSLY